MKNFEKLKMTLFDSSNANFIIGVEAQFTRGNRDTGFRDIVYTTDRATGIVNPNIYLTFSYKGDDVSPVYTSYPQLFRIREAFETVKNWVADGSGFMTFEGALCVKSNCDQPVVVANIGKNNNWMSLKLVAAESDENGILVVTPCVAIELSSSNRLTSILTAEEFLTVYTIVKDLNLSTLQCMMSLGFLSVDKSASNQYYPPVNQGMNMMPQQPMQNGWNSPQPQGYPQQSAPMGNNYYQQSNARPKYNNQSYRATPPRQVAPPPTARPQTTEVNSWPNDTNPYGAASAPVSEGLPPRSTQPNNIMSMKAVENTPISEISYDDTAAIDAIFDDND